jgi:fatty acid desaturase
MSIMEEVTGNELRELSQINGSVFTIKFLIWISIIAISSFLVVLMPSFWKIIPIVLLSSMYAHGVELQHQCLHYTAFRRKILNKICGFLLGLPMFVSFSDYQYSHLKHHRDLGTPENKEYFNYGQKPQNLLTFIPHLFMIGHYKEVLKYLLYAIIGKQKKEIPVKVSKSILIEYRLIILLLIFISVFSIILKSDFVIYSWLIPFLLSVPLHVLLELPEHMGCETEVTDVSKNTRTIKANKFALWFTNGNNFHVEHHWLPSVPVEKLPSLHKKIQHKQKYYETTYLSFYKNFFMSLIQNSKSQNIIKK